MNNRRINFRVWDKTQKKMYGWVTIERAKGNGIWYWLSLQKDNNILLQFTGLQDKNGKDIYEGDIVKYLFDIQPKAEVKWSKRNCAFEYYFLKKKGGFLPNEQRVNQSEYGITNHMGAHEVEIIGNIYENPELLEIK